MMVNGTRREIVTFALHSVRDENIHEVQVFGFWPKRADRLTLLSAVGVEGEYGKLIFSPSPKCFN